MAFLQSRVLQAMAGALDAAEAGLRTLLRGKPRPDAMGFVFATTGGTYTTLARRAARTLRGVMPDAQIDLFTDQRIADPVFSQIHRLDHGFFRPKMEALRRSRFQKTVCLDADIVVLADLSELFAVLDKADLAACQGFARGGLFLGGSEIPRAYPMLNSGVVALRRSRASQAFLREWEMRVRTTKADVDQVAMRQTLYDRNLAFLVLPLEYNLIFTQLLDVWDDNMGAPRILHIPALHQGDPGDPEEPLAAAPLLKPHQAKRLAEVMAADISLTRGPAPIHAPATATGGTRWKLALRRVIGYWGKLT